MHFQQNLQQTKPKSTKFRIRWSKVPRVLGPQNQVMVILVRAKFSSRKTPQMAINRDFPGLRAFYANFMKDKIEERDIPHPMVKSAARSGPPKPVYGHFSHPDGHGQGKFSSRKTPKTAINRDFPGLRAFSTKFATDKIEEHKIPHLMVKSAACFPAPKPSYGHFSHPASHGRGNF